MAARSRFAQLLLVALILLVGVCALHPSEMRTGDPCSTALSITLLALLATILAAGGRLLPPAVVLLPLRPARPPRPPI